MDNFSILLSGILDKYLPADGEGTEREKIRIELHNAICELHYTNIYLQKSPYPIHILGDNILAGFKDGVFMVLSLNKYKAIQDTTDNEKKEIWNEK